MNANRSRYEHAVICVSSNLFLLATSHALAVSALALMAVSNLMVMLAVTTSVFVLIRLISKEQVTEDVTRVADIWHASGVGGRLMLLGFSGAIIGMSAAYGLGVLIGLWCALGFVSQPEIRSAARYPSFNRASLLMSYVRGWSLVLSPVTGVVASRQEPLHITGRTKNSGYMLAAALSTLMVVVQPGLATAGAWSIMMLTVNVLISALQHKNVLVHYAWHTAGIKKKILFISIALTTANLIAAAGSAVLNASILGAAVHGLLGTLIAVSAQWGALISVYAVNSLIKALSQYITQLRIKTWARQQAERNAALDGLQLAQAIWDSYVLGRQRGIASFDLQGCDQLPPIDYTQFYDLTLSNFQGASVAPIEHNQQLTRLAFTACNNVASVHLPEKVKNIVLDGSPAVPAISGGHGELFVKIVGSSLERFAKIECHRLHLERCENVANFLGQLDLSQVKGWGAADSVLLGQNDQIFPIAPLEKLRYARGNRRHIKNVRFSVRFLDDLREIRAQVLSQLTVTTERLYFRLNYPFYVGERERDRRPDNELTYNEAAESFFNQVAEDRQHVSVGPQLRIKMLSLAAFEAQKDCKSIERMCRLVERVVRKLIVSAGHAADAPDSQDSCSAAEQQMYDALGVLLNWITLPTDMERFHEIIRDAEEVPEDEGVGAAETYIQLNDPPQFEYWNPMVIA